MLLQVIATMFCAVFVLSLTLTLLFIRIDQLAMFSTSLIYCRLSNSDNSIALTGVNGKKHKLSKRTKFYKRALHYMGARFAFFSQ